MRSSPRYPYGLERREYQLLRTLRSPKHIQDFLDTLAINHEKKGETNWSPRRVLRERKAHCMEGAMLAATAFLLQGHPPLLLDLKSAPGDDDHVVALYRINEYWGAVSKTNHATLRFRDPVYKTIRELALSYFHEYFLSETGLKTLRSYSLPFNLRRYGTSWITKDEDLWELAEKLDDSPHTMLFPKSQVPLLRKADRVERAAGRIIEWSKHHPRT